MMLRKIGRRVVRAGKTVGTEMVGIAKDIVENPKVKAVGNKVKEVTAKSLLIGASILAKCADKIADKRR